jgi:parvulin-like peptidyl-prolyl isomerase
MIVQSLALRIVALVSLALGASAAGAQLVVARVNGVAITNESLDARYAEVLRERNLHVARMQDPAQARALRKEAFDRLMRDELFWQQAQAERLVVSDDEVARAFEAAAAQYPSREVFARQLSRQGFTEAAFRSHVRRLLSADRYADSVARAEVRVPDDDIEAFYKSNARLFREPERVALRRLAIAAGTDGAERAAARGHIEQLREALVRGADFDQLARKYSDDPTRQWGGALDTIALDELSASMRSAVAGLDPGGVSSVIETDAAFYVVQLSGRLPSRDVELEQARERIREHLMLERGRQSIERKARELRDRARIEWLVPL